MTTLELKHKLKAQIDKTDDAELLEKVGQILAENMYILSDEQVKAVEDARDEYDRGEFYTHEEVEIMTNKWLQEK